jgi:hypothetical protein
MAQYWRILRRGATPNYRIVRNLAQGLICTIDLEAPNEKAQVPVFKR